MKTHVLKQVCDILHLDMDMADLEQNTENYSLLRFPAYTLICDTSPYVCLLDNDKCRNEIYIEPDKKQQVKQLLAK